MIDNSLKSQAFKLKGRFYMLTVLQLMDMDRDVFVQQLAHMVAQAPRLFDHTPVVLDCSHVDKEQLDLSWLTASLREHGLFPVAVQGGDAFLNTRAQVLGLAVIHGASSADVRPIQEDSLELTSNGLSVSRTKLMVNPVRSGQQVVNKGADLVVTASVSHGAELLAEGNIHIYGALRGKALAGISGDRDARIFCQSLDAELVAIAGFYRLKEDMVKYTQPCQIFLQDEQIQIELL